MAFSPLTDPVVLGRGSPVVVTSGLATRGMLLLLEGARSRQRAKWPERPKIAGFLGQVRGRTRHGERRASRQGIDLHEARFASSTARRIAAIPSSIVSVERAYEKQR